MAKRLLDCSASDLAGMTKPELLYAIRASEGRVLASETVAAVMPLLGAITNAELAAAHGADLLLINLFDAQNPMIQGMPAGTPKENMLHELQRLTGRPIGVNLEAVDPEFVQDHDDIWKMQPGRTASAENARRLVDMGARFLVLTGNPNNGVSNRAIARALAEIRAAVGEKAIIMAGKMHGAGVPQEQGESLVTPEDVARFAQEGADVIVLPAPGTTPGMSEARARDLIDAAHRAGALAMTAVGTSQEGADINTVRQIALMSKMAGADLHHLGDAGFTGIALPENIHAYSIAIRGVRHTYARMARSINR